jgi:anti-sigma factor RsiW
LLIANRNQQSTISNVMFRPMSDCQRIEPFVTPFVDGDLQDPDRDAVARHLRACAPCASRVAAERAVRDLIRRAKPSLDAPRAPDSLRATCAKLAGRDASPGVPGALGFSGAASSSSSRGATSWRARLTPIALAATLVLIVGGAFLYQITEKSARVMAAELAADHVKCFAMNRMLGTRQAASLVERSMIARFDWPMRLPDNPAGAGLELVGARPCLYGEGKVAHIMYVHQGHPVSLFMLPNASRSRDLVRVLGHEAAIWCVGKRTFVLIAREPREEVERMAAFVQAGLQ